MWHIIHGDTFMCQIWFDFVKEEKSCGLYTKPYQKLYKFDLQVKVNVVSGSWMYATHCLMVIETCVSNMMGQYQNNRSCGLDTKTSQKAYIFDLEVKGQHCIGIMNVCNISSHVANIVCQCQSLKKLWARHETTRTDRRTDRLIPIYLE